MGDDPKQSPRKLVNQKHKWKRFKDYQKLKKLVRKNRKEEGYNMEKEVNRKEVLRLNLEAPCQFTNITCYLPFLKKTNNNKKPIQNYFLCCQC